MPQGLVIFKIQWHRGQTKAKCKLIDLDGGLGWVGWWPVWIWFFTFRCRKTLESDRIFFRICRCVSGCFASSQPLLHGCATTSQSLIEWLGVGDSLSKRLSHINKDSVSSIITRDPCSFNQTDSHSTQSTYVRWSRSWVKRYSMARTRAREVLGFGRVCGRAFRLTINATNKQLAKRVNLLSCARLQRTYVDWVLRELVWLNEHGSRVIIEETHSINRKNAHGINSLFWKDKQCKHLCSSNNSS